jgi:hypothetical protein
MAEEIFDQIAVELREQVVTPPVAAQESSSENNDLSSTAEQNQQADESNSGDSKSTQESSQSTSAEGENDNLEWYEKPTEEKSNVQKEEKAEPNTTETELDEDLKLLAEYKKSGKSLADFVKEYQVQDFSTWNDEKFVEEGLKNFMTLEQEEMEQALYDYKNSSVFQKKQLVESFKEKFERQNQEKLKELKGSNSDLEAKTEAIAQKYRTDLEQYSQEIVNKEMYGIKITDEMSNRLKQYIDKEFSIQKEDGSFDIEKVYNIALWLNYGADVVKANVTKAKNEGREQVLKEVTNPSRNMSSSGKLVSSGLEAVQDAFNNLFPG